MTDFEKGLEFMHRIDDLFRNAVEKNFKNLILNGQGNSGLNFHAYISDKNSDFKATEYFYKGTPEFFHLTSVSNLLSILNYNTFRLYNIHSSKDPQEYVYGADLLHLTKSQAEIGKEYLYTFSFCSLNQLENKKIWEVYGDNFKGACIVFRIINDPTLWINYHMSEVKYEEPENFKIFRQEKKSIEDSYGITLTCDLSKLIGFHKIKKWEEEKEIRLITFAPHKKQEDYYKLSKTEFRIEPPRNRIARYIDFPIAQI